MRKHFLILMLLTLLPFTAWAEDYSDYTLKIYKGGGEFTEAVYDQTGITLAGLTLKLEKDEAEPVEVSGDAFNVTWSDGSETAPTLAENVGTYTVTVTSTTHGLPEPCTASFAITAATPTVTAPQAFSGLSYNGGNQPLIEHQGSASPGTLQYAVTGADENVAPGTGWFDDPDAIRAEHAGNYKIWFKVEADEVNHNWTAAAAQAIPVNIAKANATVTYPVASGNSSYTGDPQNLFTVGTSSEGTTLSYFVKSSEGAPDADEPFGWTTTVQQQSNAGTYYLYYKLNGGNNYNSEDPTYFGTVEIAKANAEVTAPEAIEGFTYTGVPQNLFTGGSSSQGTTFYYYVASSEGTPEVNADGWSTTAPQPTNAGTYYLYYKLDGGNNYNDVDPTYVGTVNIAKAATNECTVQPEQIAGKTYDGNEVNLTINKGTFTYGTATAVIKFATSATAPADQWTTTAPKGFNNLDLEGKWYYKSVVEETDNYAAAESEVKSFVISPVTITYFITGTTYNVGDVLDVKNHYSKANGEFFGTEKLADYAEFKFYTTGDQAVPVDNEGRLTTKGTYPVSALRIVWKNDVAHNYDFRFTSTGNIVVAAKSIAAFFTAPAIAEEFTYDGNEKTLTTVPALYMTEEDATNEENALVEGTDYEISYRKNVNAGQAELVYKGLDNYDDELVVNFTIKKATITADDFEEPSAISGLSYNATEKTLIKAGTIDASLGSFQYKLGDGDYAAALPKATAAGNYAVTWKIVGSANYNDYTITTPAVAPATESTVTSEWPVENVKIAKAMLVIQPKAAKNVLYTGTEPDVSDVELVYTRFYGNDSKALFHDGDITVKVAKEIVDANYAKANYEEGLEVVVGSNVELQNYEIYPVNGALNIKAPLVKVELVDWTKNNKFGASVPGPWNLLTSDYAKLHVLVQTGFDADGNATWPEVTDQYNWPNATEYLATTGTGDTQTFKNLLITRESGTSVKKYALTLSGVTTNSNYELAATEDAMTVDATSSYYEITATDIVVKAGNRSKVYGTTTDPQFAISVTGGTLTTEQQTFIKNHMQRVGAGTEEGENVGVYEINFKKDVAEGKDGPEIEGLNITYQVGAFAITPATLTIAAVDQTLYTTNTAANLKTGKDVAYTVTGLVDGDEEPAVEVEFADFVQVDNDKKLIIEGFTTAPAFVEYKRPNTLGAPFNKPGLAVKVTNLDAFAQNYEVVLDSAVLKVVNVETTIILSKINDNTSAIEAAKTKAVNIVFADEDIVIKKEKWYTMVLPFNTSVQEFSSVFGYAVVDTLNENNNTKNIQFRLHMQDLPANKPFIFKIFKDKNLKDVDFGAKTIVYAENLADDEVCGKDVFGNKYIGTYAGKTGFTAYEWRMTTDATLNPDGSYKYDKWYYGGTGSENKTIAPLAAYVLSVEPGGTAHFNAPIITIEDLGEDGTTVIKQLNEETMDAYNVDGWYTLDGIKLQNMPTQKGIYINNGKKVVVK